MLSLCSPKCNGVHRFETILTIEPKLPTVKVLRIVGENGGGSYTMDPQDYIERARSAIREGEFDLAEQYFNLVLQSAPSHPEAIEGLKEVRVARVRKGWSRPLQLIIELWNRLLMALGRYEQALGSLDLLHRSNPGRFSVAFAYAKCCDKLGRRSEALDAYRSALALRSQHVPSLRRAAELAAQEDHLEEAVEYFKRLSLQLPDHDEIDHRMRDLLARKYAQTGIPEKLTEERAKMEKSLREMPGTPEFARRLEQLEAEAAKNPNDIEAALRVIEHLRGGRAHDEANKRLAPIIDKNPGNFNVRLEQARLWRDEQDYPLATNLYEELLKERPQDVDLKQDYLNCRANLLEQQLKENPSDESLRQRFTEALYERDEHRISVLKQHLQVHPEDHPKRLELGRLLAGGKQYDDAISVLQRLLHEPPMAGEALLILGECFRERNQLELAAEQYRKAIQYFKNRGYSHVPSDELKEAYYYLGVCLEKQGNLKEARDAYSFIYATDINYRDIRTRYERTYQGSASGG